MKTIPTTFKKYGHVFTQIVREDNIALYKRTNDAGKVLCYELIIITIATAKALPSGKVSPTKELYPNSSKFGELGWSLIRHTELKALDRFRQLVNKRQEQAEQKQSQQPSTTNKAA